MWNNSLDPSNPRYTRMVYVPGGTFRMGGDPSDTTGTFGAIAHTVTISGFLMDSTEVTQEDWNSVMASNPSRRIDCPRCPIENVTWFEAILYCNARSKRQGLDTVYQWAGATFESGRVVKMASLRQFRLRNGYRLPSEAEWEYAARGGTSSWWYWGNDSNQISKYGWTGRIPAPVTRPVADLAPTGLGFYDLQGNVGELVFDWLGSFDSKSKSDPTGPESGLYRVFRGGAISDDFCPPKNHERNAMLPGDANDFIGFRCARSLVP
ncbi:MAG: SUMF1/EgtB/PvdO family nonheme iron enzyme [Fibrobacterota bacterium]|nr:SUMF1/EgtB/PvdO family nonheme iron enzyme [Fibrobacterota bacterium]QQS03757.1 MAG: SUMF1/EgtB/PvdO family nonheme iron enzyme [Fibrobacterota bacterium]